MRKLSLLGVFLFVTTVFPTKAFAGGGPVALYAFALRPFDQTKTFILDAETTTSQPCNQIKPTFAFKDSVDADSITPFTPPDDGTYITRHFNTGWPDFKWKELCETYVQAKSGVASQRTVTVNVVVGSQNQEREIGVAFGDDYFSRQVQSYGRVNDYDNTAHLDIINEIYKGQDKRDVQIQWQKIAWAAKYVVFQADANVVVDKTHVYTVLTTTQETKITITLPAFSSFYLVAMACKADDPCDTWKESIYGPVLLDKMRKVDRQGAKPTPPQQINAITPYKGPVATVQPTNAASNKTVEELNQKVTDLQSQLSESQKKQSFLEQRVNDLVALIHRLFPFFK